MNPADFPGTVPLKIHLFARNYITEENEIELNWTGYENQICSVRLGFKSTTGPIDSIGPACNRKHIIGRGMKFSYLMLTRDACGPSSPSSASNSTRVPVSKSLNGIPDTEFRWK